MRAAVDIAAQLRALAHDNDAEGRIVALGAERPARLEIGEAAQHLYPVQPFRFVLGHAPLPLFVPLTVFAPGRQAQPV